MRPLRIEMDGFSAFRESTVVDFADADLFAFVGPTGAGKSSVIDAMVFALYGSVPRLDAKLVHPVITQGKPEARVRFDFEVGGDTYTAVRVVRRTKAGASTKEARLERGDEVLAEDVRTMNPAVVELLGLDLDQFTKCVVLPQGEFAALLHETRKHRQDLLVKLLDLGVYGDVAQAARRRMSAADHRLAVIDEQIGDLDRATDEAVAAAASRITQLEAVVAEIAAAEVTLAANDERVRVLRTAAEEHERHRRALAAVEPPVGLVEAQARRVEADAALARAVVAEEAATSALTDAERRRADAGDEADVARQLALLDEIAELDARIAKGIEKVDLQRAAIEPLATAATEAADTTAQTATALEHARIEHAAADLAQHLHPGDDCPVCGSTVEQLAEVDRHALDAAKVTHAGALDQQKSADKSLAEATRDLDRFEAKLAELREQRETKLATVADADRAQLVAQKQAIAEAEASVTAARLAERAARTATNQAREAVDAHQEAQRAARRRLQEVRDPIAALGPPALSDDTAGDWAALHAWAAERIDEATSALGALHDEIVVIEKQHAELLATITDRARSHGIAITEPDARTLRDAAVAAAAAARHEHERLETDAKRRAGLVDERSAVADQRGVFEIVARRLQPDSFQKWLLGEALTALVAGASARLEELSSGRYGLVLDDDEFAVVDHANADEHRMARTLSGGETFLASLSLALALAERVSELSATARLSLDAIFLDEGFGTLDPETLDVVATAIEELGANGRMVGIVSHVRDLAERVPVRFEVRPGARTSTVERVEV